MADRDELRALAERVMALAGPCRETDFWIGVRVNGSANTDAELQWDIDALGIEGMVIDAAYTSSLDAAMALGRQFLLVAMSDIAADGLPGVCLCSDTSTSPPKEHWGIALGGASGPREQVLARCYTAAALLALAEQVPA